MPPNRFPCLWPFLEENPSGLVSPVDLFINRAGGWHRPAAGSVMSVVD